MIRHRRMVRDFEHRPVPRGVLERILDVGRRGPTAGFSQGVDFLVLQTPEELELFWSTTEPDRRERTIDGPPVIVLPLSNKHAYLERYSKPDKRGLGMDVEEGWPVPFWDVDTAMAAMLVLLAAVDEGLGGWFFGIFHGEDELLSALGVPEGVRPIGAIALGPPSAGERPAGSALSERRRPLGEVVHWGRW